MKSPLILFFLFCFSGLFAEPNAVVLNYQSTYSIKHNTLYETCLVAIQVNNPDGDQYADIRLYYSDESKISNLIGWIQDAKGNKLRELESKDISDKSNIEDFSLFEDNYVKSFGLKSSVYPYVIMYSYTRERDDFLYICNWSPAYNSRIPTTKATLTVEIPQGYNISCYSTKGLEPVKDSSGNITYIWNAKYDKIIKYEMYCPTLQELIPRVMIVPVEFKYGIKGNQKTWESFGNWAYNLNKGLDELPKSEIQKVKGMVTGIDDKKTVIKKLYQYLQDNTRYVSVQVGVGGTKCFPAKYVCDRKYGDCKGLANYMKALLKVAGIESEMVLVHADGAQNHMNVISGFVASQFNHVILVVPLDHDSVWLDCTSHTNPAGYLGTFTQNRYALVVNENNSKLVKTPTMNSLNCYTISKNKISFDTSGNELLESSNFFAGNMYEKYIRFSTQVSKNEIKKYEYEILPYQNYEIKNFAIETPNRDSSCIRVKYKLLLKNNTIQSKKYKVFSLGGLKLADFESPVKRTFPVRISYPNYYTDSTTVNIPEGYKALEPQDINVETPYGTIKVEHRMHDNYLEVYRSLLLKEGEYGIEEYPAFYKFVTEFGKAAAISINMKKDE